MLYCLGHASYICLFTYFVAMCQMCWILHLHQLLWHHQPLKSYRDECSFAFTVISRRTKSKIYTKVRLTKFSLTAVRQPLAQAATSNAVRRSRSDSGLHVTGPSPSSRQPQPNLQELSGESEPHASGIKSQFSHHYF